VFFDMGFNLGKDDEEFVEQPALNNHYEIVLRYGTVNTWRHMLKTSAVITNLHQKSTASSEYWYGQQGQQ
jgi:hypothetical protein